MIDSRRYQMLKQREFSGGPVVYWMNRDQRVNDNWALLLAQEIAVEKSQPLVVISCVPPKFLDATIRQFTFMLEGLKQVSSDLQKKEIPFALLHGDPSTEIPAFIRQIGAGALVTDFSPLAIHREWKATIVDRADIPVYEVDAHNILPCWIASDKREFAAYTIRPKINRLLPEFLTEFPSLKKQRKECKSELPDPDWEGAFQSLDVDRSVGEVRWLIPGEDSALKVLNDFLEKKLPDYAYLRNDPTLRIQSQLSPYLHFGQISAQRVALEAMKHDKHTASLEAFLEELIVRRELSDNFCFYADSYDKVDCFPDWAKRTLDDHRYDERQYLYDTTDLEVAQTHDDLWNAAQLELVQTGKMHGYMRMYWAKKILEWSPSPEQAMSAAIYLNDKYALDGCDSNGYTGIAWSIGGVHDRAWKEREIFGKIRYMSESGCRRKFNADQYIANIGAVADLKVT